MNDKEAKRRDPEKPVSVLDEIIARLDKIHERFVEAAANIGHALSALRAARPAWERLANATTKDPEAAKLYDENIGILFSFSEEVEAAQYVAWPTAQLLDNIAGTAVTFTSASGSTASFFEAGIPYAPSEVPVFISPALHDHNVQRFSAFDEALGKTYREIWESLYGTRGDPERAALYLIRQAFDLLFGRLAPDDAVRASPFWHRKDGEKPDEIWRDERIQYAAATHIKDSARSKTLSASSKHMLEVYRALNRAHDRNAINRDKALNALAEMRSILEDWANAVGL